MFTTEPDRIVFCHTIPQKCLEDLAKENSKVELKLGFSPDLYLDHDKSEHLLLCLDDMMSTPGIHEHLADLFTKYR